LAIDRIEDTEIPLEVVATSLVDGSEHWFTSGPIVDSVLASAAIPGIFPPVEVEGETFIDGGVVNNVPIGRAIAAGARTLYVLLCGPSGHVPVVGKRPIEAVIGAFFTSIHSRFAREIEQAPPHVQTFVFNGTGRFVEDFRDFRSSPAMILAGRNEVARVLDAGIADRHSALVD